MSFPRLDDKLLQFQIRNGTNVYQICEAPKSLTASTLIWLTVVKEKTVSPAPPYKRDDISYCSRA
jgi:hypothetical protein